MTSATGDRLREAARLIRDKGWCQGVYRDDAGRHCAVGALCEATGDGGLDLARSYLWQRIRTTSIADWNDRPGRTEQDVIAAFESAAALADDDTEEAAA